MPSLACVEEVWFVMKFIYFHRNCASALCCVEFDLWQNIFFLPQLCIFVNDLIYRLKQGLDVLVWRYSERVTLADCQNFHMI